VDGRNTGHNTSDLERVLQANIKQHYMAAIPILRDSHEACIVFNAPYAAKQHEEFPKKNGIHGRQILHVQETLCQWNSIYYYVAEAIKL